MSVRYLLDTNVLSEETLPRPSKKVMTRLRTHAEEVSTASVVWHELWFGVCRLPPSRRREHIERHLREAVAGTMPILPYDERAAVWHAAERARLAGRGRTPPFADGQIAAIAQVNDLILVTRNVADFADFQDLRVENWHH